MKTIEEFRRGGGHVARVPGDLSHIYTRPKAINKPDGSTYYGPEVLMTEMVAENGVPTRVVRFTSLQDFQRLKRDLAWQVINPELCTKVSQTLCVDNASRGASPI